MPAATRPVVIGIDAALAPWLDETRYVFRTLMRTAGYPYAFVRAEEAAGAPLDIYYGPRRDIEAGCSIAWSGRSFSTAAYLDPEAADDQAGLRFLRFAGDAPGAIDRSIGRPHVTNDLVFGSFWMLTGARDPTYARDRWDNIDLGERVLHSAGLLQTPIVSLYAAWFREQLRATGRVPAPAPWSTASGPGAFVFSHDVDYPEIIRWIECLRVVGARGLGGLRSAAGILGGSNHFWKFGDWIALEKAYGTRPAFYFMARRGSLAQYALGVPDAFYDIRSPRFRDLFRQLRDEGCEIGLHASYLAHRSADTLAREKALVEEMAGVAVAGGRHHYWHLDPAAPHETLAKHARIGMAYDSSLAFELYPGFRRGICHPFRVFHPGERREIDLVELPPTWMDDHFDRRLVRNGIREPDAAAASLLDVVRRTGGVAVVDYHARGMNGDIYPRYGAWLGAVLEQHVAGRFTCRRPIDIVRDYQGYERALEERSSDRFREPAAVVPVPHGRTGFSIGALRPDEIPQVAQLHVEIFGVGENRGHSLANLGVEFLAAVFYELNLDNPYLFVDVARWNGAVAGFSVYTSDWRRVSREMLRRHAGHLARRVVAFAARHPLRLAGHAIGNLRFVLDSAPPVVGDIDGWWMIAGVRPEYRSREFRSRTGIQVSAALWDQMMRTLAAHGCREIWAAAGAHRGPINAFLREREAPFLAQVRLQGVLCNIYRQPVTLPKDDGRAA